MTVALPRGQTGALPFQSSRMVMARGVARTLILIGRTALGRRLIIQARKIRLLNGALNRLLAFRGSFATLKEAEECVARYVSVNGHEHGHLIASQVAGARVTRSSDYPVLFYLAPVISQLRSAFDLGGSVGNLFYVLSDHLPFPEDFVWMVHDLPAKKEFALALARDNHERRVIFADVFSEASGVDLFIAVGAIHYFELTLPELLCTLDKLPAHVILNRSPFFESQDMAVVHDDREWIIPCKLHDAGRLVSEMVKLGYDLVGSWSVPERTMQIPLYPEYRETYKGFYFRLKNAPLPRCESETVN